MVRNTFLITSAFLIAAVIYFVGDTDMFDEEILGLEKEIRVIFSDCRISESKCMVKISDQATLKLDLQTKPLPVMEPMFLALRLSEKLFFQKAWFEGRDMFMGQHYLIPDGESKNTPDQQIILKGMIPVCQIESSMTWRLVLEFLYKQETIQIHFEQNINAE